MAIKLVQFQDKVNINANPDLPEINKVIDSNMNEMKYVANTNANNIGDLEKLSTIDKGSLVNAINNLAYNLVTNGPAIKTGRQVDGKYEYVKRYKISIVEGTINGNAPLDFEISDVTISRMIGYIVYNNGNIYNLDTNNYRYPEDYTYMYINEEQQDIRIFCSTPEHYSYAVVEIYFVYN